MKINFPLLILFFLFIGLEFFIFYQIATFAANYSSWTTNQLFLAICGIDLIATLIVFPEEIRAFYNALFYTDD
jgi:hypothetical protein